MTRPAVRHLGGERWELVEVMRAQGVHVPRGFVFRPSVPRIAWPLVSPLETLYASAVHDYMYRHRIGTRRRADRVFLRIMREQGQAWWRRRLAYVAVRAGGWLYWDEWIE